MCKEMKRSRAVEPPVAGLLHKRHCIDAHDALDTMDMCPTLYHTLGKRSGPESLSSRPLKRVCDRGEVSSVASHVRESVMVPKEVFLSMWNERLGLLERLRHMGKIIDELRYYIRTREAGRNHALVRQCTVR